MEDSIISLVVAIIALITSLFTLLYKNKPTPKADDNFASKPLRLQAYERLVLLCERISLPSLISRVNIPGISAREMQLMLIETIKQEYEYNVNATGVCKFCCLGRSKKPARPDHADHQSGGQHPAA